MSKRNEPIVDWNLDDATYVGNGTDGCYYLAREHQGKWYVTIVVDCNTSHFCDDLEADAGPYDSQADAEAYGHNVALDWCMDNGVES